VALPDDDRRAVAARLATTAAAAVDVLARAVDDDEELREVLVDIHGDVVALTARRALFLAAGDDAPQAFEYGDVEVRRRGEGLGVDVRVEGSSLVLDVARSTFVRLGVVAEGNPPGRATWLPVRTPAPKPRPEPTPPATAADDAGAVPVPAQGLPGVPLPSGAVPPPGWHPDPSGRHWWRWWDGRGWTDHVADGGAPYVDPLPPPPT
jgi:hypothetical protein